MLPGMEEKDVVLTKINMTAPACMTYHCLVCRKVVVEYGR